MFCLALASVPLRSHGFAVFEDDGIVPVWVSLGIDSLRMRSTCSYYSSSSYHKDNLPTLSHCSTIMFRVPFIQVSREYNLTI